MGTVQIPAERDVELSDISQEELNRRPWKYIGYKEFAKYSSLTDDNFVLRRYDRLHCRVLVTLQQRIAVLEENLDELDEMLCRRIPDVDNGTVRNDQPERQRLLEEIAKELKTYADMVLSYRELKSVQSAPKSSISNINTWIRNANGPIEETEVEFLKARDLITVASSRKSFLRQRFENHILVPTKGLFGRLGTRVGPNGTNVYDGDLSVDAMASVSTLAVGTGLLIAPLWVLTNTQGMNKRLGVITASIAIFSSFLLSTTPAKPFRDLGRNGSIFCGIGSLPPDW